MTNIEHIEKLLAGIKAMDNVDQNSVFSAMISYGVQNVWSDTSDINQNLSRRLAQEQMRVQSIDGFLVASSGPIRIDQPRITLYIPLDLNNLSFGIDSLFTHIAQKGISHLSYIRNCYCNDTVAISVNSVKDAEEIINFIKNDRFLQQWVMKSSPLMPSVSLGDDKSIGIVEEPTVGEYNFKLAEFISKIINYKTGKDRFNTDSLSNGFVEEVRYYGTGNKEMYNLALEVLSGRFSYEKYVSNLKVKRGEAYQVPQNLTTSSDVFEAIVLKTCDADGLDKAVTAVNNYKMYGDASYFTNDSALWQQLQALVNPADVIPIMRRALETRNIPTPNGDVALITKYIDVLFSEKTMAGAQYQA